MPETRAPIIITGQSLDAIAALVADRTLPPVEKWNPDRCGDSEMRIARDGSWYHQGQPITRPAMVRLFSTVLRREPDGSHVLVTPVERLSIEVEATAFVAFEMESEGSHENRRIALSLNSGDALVIGRDHPLRIVEDEHGPQPRVAVRHGLEATLARPLYYELAEIALAEHHNPPGVWSDGCFFPLSPAP
jgi:hypothetical protein